MGLLDAFLIGAGGGVGDESLRQQREGMKRDADEEAAQKAAARQKDLAAFTNKLGWDRDKDMAAINFNNNRQLNQDRFDHDDASQGKQFEFQSGQQQAQFKFQGGQNDKNREVERERINATRKDWKQNLYERAVDGDPKAAQILNLMTPATADRDNWVMAQDGRVRTNKYTGQTFVMQGNGADAYWQEVGASQQKRGATSPQATPTPAAPPVNYKGKFGW